MKSSVHDEEKLIYTLNRLKMSTIIYYYIDVGGGQPLGGGHPLVKDMNSERRCPLWADY